MKKLIAMILALTFMLSGASMALAEDTNIPANKPTLDQRVDKRIQQQQQKDQLREQRQEKKDELQAIKAEYQKLKDLRNQLDQLRKDYNSKRVEFRKAVIKAKNNKDKAKLQKALADIKGIRDLLKDRNNGYAIGTQLVQELQQARTNKNFERVKAIVQTMANNLNNRIDLLKQINAKLDQAIADLQ